MREQIKVIAGRGEHRFTDGAAQSIEAHGGGAVVHRGSVRRISTTHYGEVYVEGNASEVHARGGNVSVHGDVSTAIAESGGVIYVYGKVNKATVDGVACVRATQGIEERTIRGQEGPYTVLAEFSRIDKDAERAFEKRLGIRSV